MEEQKYVPLIKLKMIKIRELPYTWEKLNRPDKVAEFAMQLLEGADKEHLMVISVSAKCRPLAFEIVSIGSVDSAFVVPREVFKHAIVNNAVGILLVHNHPSGDCKPSEDDLCITERIRKAGDLLGIQVFDHVILGEGNFYSFREERKI